MALSVLGGAVSTVFAFIDYGLLSQEYRVFAAASHSRDLSQIMVAATNQELRRMNVFAEGVWALLCAILFVICLVALHHDGDHIPGSSDGIGLPS